MYSVTYKYGGSGDITAWAKLCDSTAFGKKKAFHIVVFVPQNIKIWLFLNVLNLFLTYKC